MHLCDTSAKIILEGELQEWDDIRLHFCANNNNETRKVNGKVTSVRVMTGVPLEADLRFTSVSQEAYNFIGKLACKPANIPNVVATFPRPLKKIFAVAPVSFLLGV